MSSSGKSEWQPNMDVFLPVLTIVLAVLWALVGMMLTDEALEIVKTARSTIYIGAGVLVVVGLLLATVRSPKKN